MKRLLLLFSLILVLCTEVNAQAVGTDRSFDADVYKYKTYAWSTNIDQIPVSKIFVGPGGVLVYNNESARSKIKDAIQYELSARGYKMAPNNADFLVTFKVLEQPGELITYNGYKTVNINIDTFHTKENMQRTQVKAGTLLIDFIDSKTSQQVWQGYASGALNPDIINSTAKVREAVSSIFQKYKYKAPEK